MRPRLFAPIFYAALLIAPDFSADLKAADDAVRPAVVLQVRSIDELLASLNTAAKNFLPEAAHKEFEKDILSGLDLNKIKGVDSKKPFGFYATIGDGVLQGDFSKCSVVVLVPVSDETAFVDLLGKIGLRPEKKGDEYSIPIPNVPVPASMRFLKGYAYICVATAKIDAGALLDPKEVFSAKETAAAVLRFRIDRVPDDLRKQFLAAFTQNMAKDIDALKKMGGPADEAPTPQLVRRETTIRTMQWGVRWLNLLINDGKELIFRIDFDPKTGLLGSEMSLEARNGSDLAKSIGQLRQTTNDFAGLIGADSVGFLLVQAPLFIDDFKEMLATLTLWAGQGAARDLPAETPKEFRDLVLQATKALSGMLNDGKFNFAASMHGPDRNNQFTAVGAFSLKDTASLDKALRMVAKSAPKEKADMIKFDAFKVQGISVHEIAVGDLLPPEAQKVFGKSSVYFGLSPNAAFVTFGPRGKEVMTEALTGKLGPKPAPLVQAEISGKRLLALFKALDAPPEPIQFIEKLSSAERSSVMSIKVEGGDKLLVRLELGLPALWILSPKAGK